MAVCDGGGNLCFKKLVTFPFVLKNAGKLVVKTGKRSEFNLNQNAATLPGKGMRDIVCSMPRSLGVNMPLDYYKE